LAALAVNTTDRVCRRIFKNENISSSVSPAPTLVHAFHFTHLLDVTLAAAALSLTVAELLPLTAAAPVAVLEAAVVVEVVEVVLLLGVEVAAVVEVEAVVEVAVEALF
jgi:hypothetical protein